MERYKFNDKKSIYDYIRNQNFSSIKTEDTLKISEELSFHSEIKRLEGRIDELVKKVSMDKMDIGDILKDLEYSTAQGSNDKKISQVFYNSKLFLQIISCINFAKQEYMSKLLSFIEKMIRGNKLIAKYMSKNIEFVKRIFSLMKRSEFYDICIKISEEIFMNSEEPIAIGKVYKELEDIYNLAQMNNRLDTFCKILAIMIFDHKKVEFKQIFKYRENLKFRPSLRISTENQNICCNLPNFIQNIMKTLKGKLDHTMNTINLFYSSTEQEGEQIHAEFYQHNKNYLITPELKNLVIQCNIFSNFTPNWKDNKLRSPDNIFNWHSKIRRLYEKLKNKSKITEYCKNHLTVLKYTTCQLEIFFVLSTILGCKRKVELQDKIASYDVIKILSSYLEYIDWGNICQDTSRPFFEGDDINFGDETAYHGRGCKCDSDTALKIQYLRLIYTYCCRDSSNVSNKLKMISEEDMRIILNAGYLKMFCIYINNYICKGEVKFNNNYKYVLSVVEDILEDNTQDMKKPSKGNETVQDLILAGTNLEHLERFINYFNVNDKKIGLLRKLIIKYVNECQYSSAKFWLASCIEVMVRGNNTFYQYFIAHSGLIPILLYDILYHKSDQVQILQLSFDILGEVIKFNKANFLLLNFYFVDNNEYKEVTRKLISKETLIDSNVFLRSILISISYFDTCDTKQKLNPDEYFSNRCKFCTFVKQNIYTIFLSLADTVKPSDINQTNISCINTALLILIYEDLNKTLGNFLMEVRKVPGSEESLKNFRGLLEMWRDFYNYRPKDSASLQHSTMINFNTWHKVALTLLDQDTNKIESLSYKI